MELVSILTFKHIILKTGQSYIYTRYVRIVCMFAIFNYLCKSVPLASKVVNSYAVHSEVYSIKHFVIKFVSVLRQVWGFSHGTLVFSINNTDCHDINEILLKVALNTINQPNQTIVKL